MGLNCNPHSESCTFTKLVCWIREEEFFLLFCSYSSGGGYLIWAMLSLTCWHLLGRMSLKKKDNYYRTREKTPHPHHHQKQQQPINITDRFLWHAHVRFTEKGHVIGPFDDGRFTIRAFLVLFLLLLRCKQHNTSEGTKASLSRVPYWWIKVALGNGKTSVSYVDSLN